MRRDLQILSAQGDRLWVAVTELQRGLEDLETEQATMQQRMNQILQRVKSLTKSWSGGQTQLDVGFIKVREKTKPELSSNCLRVKMIALVLLNKASVL